MPTAVIMPALELAQETGKVLRWLKSPGDPVRKGEPIVEIETDKVTTEIEAAASGILREITAREGDVVPVGQPIALIATADEAVATPSARPAAAGAGASAGAAPSAAAGPAAAGRSAAATSGGGVTATGAPLSPGAAASGGAGAVVKASPLARKLAEQHGIDLTRVKTATGRIDKADVLAYIESLKAAPATNGAAGRRAEASPKARRIAAERGIDIAMLHGSGPHGAVLAGDVPESGAAAAAAGTGPVAGVRPAAHAAPETATAPFAATAASAAPAPSAATARPSAAAPAGGPAPAAERPSGTRPADGTGVSTVWRLMAERMTASWTTAPHFYLVREVNVSRLVAWRDRATKQTDARITYTDLLVRLVAAAIARHPRVNASWKDAAIARNQDINIGLAVAVDDGLIVPVIHRADTLTIQEIATRREDVVTRGQAGKLRPADIQGGGFTISNLGMYGVDAFSAIVNPPQAAILAVGRIADRVVPVAGQPAVQPMMVLTLSCDHRALDGARAAHFLGTLSELIEEPLALLA